MPLKELAHGTPIAFPANPDPSVKKSPYRKDMNAKMMNGRIISPLKRYDYACEKEIWKLVTGITNRKCFM